MKILLTTINAKYIHHNLAIRLLYELNKIFEGLEVKEFNSKDNINGIIDYCCHFDLVAFSCYIWNLQPVLEVAKGIKQRNGNCKILLGGPEVSYEWQEIIALPYIDFIIAGEGEIPFSALLKLYPQTQLVPGLIWKNDGKVTENGAPELFNLKLLQNINPYAGIADEELLHKISYIEASRGCPNCCEFCLAGLEKKIRYMPEKAIQSNLLYLMERGRVIKFLDRTFNTHPAFTISVFRFILEHYRPGNIFQFEIKADIIQKQVIEFIRAHVPKGVFRFEIGIQTLNSLSNKEIRRKQNFGNIKYFIDQISDKVEIHLDLIVGLPHDYMADIKYSFEEVFKLFAPELQLGFLKFLKGTPIRENCKEHDYRFEPAPPYQIIESRYLSREQLAEVVLVEDALDIYWNRKRALYSLRYVALNHSIFDFLKGLGKARKERSEQGLSGVYNMLYDYSFLHYPGDNLLVELIGLDYYLQHQVKPAVRFLQEVSRAEKNEITERLKLNHHKYRYGMHRVNFSVQSLLEQHVFVPASDLLIIEYSGINRPKVLFFK